MADEMFGKKSSKEESEHMGHGITKHTHFTAACGAVGCKSPMTDKYPTMDDAAQAVVIHNRMHQMGLDN